MRISAIGNFFQQKQNKKDNNVSFGTAIKGFPRIVEYGISERCNLRCPYCPKHLGSRGIPENTVMSMALFVKGLKDLGAILYDGIINLHRFSEPLLLKDAEDYIIRTKELLPEAQIELITNGTVLTKKRLEALKKTPLDSIIVTQHFGVKNGFMERLKDIPYELLDNVDAKYGDELDLINRAGVLRQLYKPSESPCYSIHNTFAIDPDGKVPLCVDAYYRQIILGDINNETIEEIWNKPSTQELIKKLDAGKRKEIEVCKNCDRTPEKRALNAIAGNDNRAIYRKWLLEKYGDAHLTTPETEAIRRVEFEEFMSKAGI